RGRLGHRGPSAVGPRSRIAGALRYPARPASPFSERPVNVLVAAGAGFIGSNFVRQWIREHGKDRVVILDALTYAGNLANLDDLSGRFAFVHADIGDRPTIEAALRDHAVDVIVNFAAESHNSYAVLDPEIFFRTNALGTASLCEAARRVGISRLHHI